MAQTMTKDWRNIDRTRPLPYPTRMCRRCFGFGWMQLNGGKAETCGNCHGEGRVERVR